MRYASAKVGEGGAPPEWRRAHAQGLLQERALKEERQHLPVAVAVGLLPGARHLAAKRRPLQHLSAPQGERGWVEELRPLLHMKMAYGRGLGVQGKF